MGWIALAMVAVVSIYDAASYDQAPMAVPPQRRGGLGPETAKVEDAPGPQNQETVEAPARKRVVVIGAVLLPIVAFAALLGFGLGRDPRLVPSAVVGRHAPLFALRTLDGDRVIRLSDLKGRVVVVNFWASWCLACREEHPNLMATWQRFGDAGVVLLGVVYQDSPQNARAYLRELGRGWPNLVDPGSRTALDYGVRGVPETFFIGRDGVVAYQQIGPASSDVLTHQVQRLLGWSRP